MGDIMSFCHMEICNQIFMFKSNKFQHHAFSMDQLQAPDPSYSMGCNLFGAAPPNPCLCKWVMCVLFIMCCALCILCYVLYVMSFVLCDYAGQAGMLHHAKSDIVA